MDMTITQPQPKKLIERFAERFGVDPGKLMTTLKQTAFRQRGDKEITNEQMMALLVVADQYNLNPWTKEIFAFDDKNMGIIPVVSVDGWTRLVNSHRDYDGLEFTYSDAIAATPDGKPCPEWCEVAFYRKGMSRPIVVREYLDEVYVGKRGGYSGPWQSHTKRMLRHKTLIQGARVAFGFAGIYDEDEAYRIIDGEHTRVASSTAGGANTQQLQAALEQRSQPAIESQRVEAFIDPISEMPEAVRVAEADTEPGPAAMAATDRPSDASLVYGSEGPEGLMKMIDAMDMGSQPAADEMLATIATIDDEGVRKQLTRHLFSRKSEHISR